MEKKIKIYVKSRIEVMTSHGLLQYSNEDVALENVYGKIVPFFGVRAARNKLYKWAMPSVKIAFRQMPRNDRRTYLDILRHAEKYLSTFNPDREADYLGRLKLADNHHTCGSREWEKKNFFPKPEDEKWLIEKYSYLTCEHLFTMYDSHGKEDPYRKIEIFFYRRIVADGWRKEDIQSILRRAIVDLAPLT